MSNAEGRRPNAERRMLVATTNPGKLAEIREILDALPIAVETLAEHAGIPEPDENGATFAENARLKAVHYATATGTARRGRGLRPVDRRARRRAWRPVGAV